MGQSAGHDGKPGPPGPERPQFVADLAGCVADWSRALSGHALDDTTASALTQRSLPIEQRSGALGFGGIGHHLRELFALASRRASVAELRAQLAVVEDLLVAARGVLTPEELARSAARPASAHPGAAPGAFAPPPLITVAGARAPIPGNSPGRPPSAAPPPAFSGPEPPRLLFDSRIVARGAGPSAPAPAIPAGPAPAPAPAPLPVLQNLAPAPAPHPVLPAHPEPALPPPMSPSAGLAPMPAAPARLSGGGASGVRPAQPNLFVRSVLGLRAFGRKGAPVEAEHGQPAPAPGASGGSLLGLKTGPSPRAPAPVAPPALLGGYAGLPSLRPDTPSPIVQERSSGRGRVSEPSARRRDSEPPGRFRSGESQSRGRGRRRPEQRESRWWVGAFAVGGVGVVVGLIVVVAVLLSRRGDPAEQSSNASGAGSATTPQAPSSAAANDDQSGLPPVRLTTENERLRSLLHQVHGRGKESAELRALVDEEAALLAEKRCEGVECAARAQAAQGILQGGPKKAVRRRSRSPDALRSKWLAGLSMPEIDVEDDPRVQKRFEFYTENPQGREVFQQMLFRCGAFKDSIQASLIRHGMPAALLAVVFAESGCSPLAKSKAGAEGLWQFIPAAARAYHLRIIDGVVDERHSPQKSTEAAIRFLSDMYAKLGSWDLVFAGYNMGPFGVAARLQMVEGENIGFWDLVDADVLPDETADYAPSIQAIALILNNLQRLKFVGAQMRAPQMTMDLEVPPSTRMTLVARAAALSLNELRTMNLDIKGGLTPGIPNFVVQVPKENVWQARETLQELLKAKDDLDQCVPASFDWGRQRFTPEMAKACASRLPATDTPAVETGTAAPAAPAAP